jgi:dynein heavy chain
MLQVYLRITAELLPTPAKSHYIYNLRDVARVVQGLMRAVPRKVQTADAFVRLWIHETLRVFHDRLITRDDKVCLGAVLLR